MTLHILERPTERDEATMREGTPPGFDEWKAQCMIDDLVDTHGTVMAALVLSKMLENAAEKVMQNG